MSSLLQEEPTQSESSEIDSAQHWALPAAISVSRKLAALVVLLCALSTLGQVSAYFFGHPRLKGFVPLFYVDLESNIPTWYSSIALAGSAVLFGVVAMAKWRLGDRFRLHWAIFAALFFALSADEVSMLHEYPIDPLRKTLDAGGMFYYTWVLPGIAFVFLFGLSMLRFLAHLPKRTRWGLLVAGFVFVGGAIGIEMISGWHADQFGEQNFTYAMIITAEEFCEMMGVVILIHVLLDYIHRELGGLRLSTVRSRFDG